MAALTVDQTFTVLLSEWDQYVPLLMNQLNIHPKYTYLLYHMKFTAVDMEESINFDNLSMRYYVSKVILCPQNVILPQRILFFYSID